MNVFIYLLDSLRADHVSCYGYDRETTPNIDAIAKEGVRFRHGYTVSTWTKQAATSLWTGTYPSAMGVTTVYDMLPEDALTLPTALSDQEFEVAGVTATGHVSSDYGFDRGFDHFQVNKNISSEREDVFTDEFGVNVSDSYNFIPPSADSLQTWLIDRFDERNTEDFVGLIWSLDTHDPFFITNQDAHFSDEGKFIGSIQNGTKSELINIYDDMIRTNDKYIGEFVDNLRQRGEYEETLLFIIGDHGEAFGEHGERGHAGPPFREQIEVPFIIKPPKSWEASFNLDRPTQLIDVMPTILNILGHSVPNYVQGEQLGVPSDRNDRTERSIYTETQYNYSRDTYESLQQGNNKLISQTPTGIRPFLKLVYQMLTNDQLQYRLSNMEHSYDLLTTISQEAAYLYYRDGAKLQLFDLTKDPDEKQNMVTKSTSGEKISELRQNLESVRSANDAIRETVQEQTFTIIDEDTQQQLEDLGYKV